MRDEWMRGKRAVLFTGAEPLECTEGREPPGLDGGLETSPDRREPGGNDGGQPCLLTTLTQVSDN